MRSEMVEKLGMDLEPVAVRLMDEKPEDAKGFKPGKWGCVMFLLAGAARGNVGAFDRETYGCPGGGVGLAFGNRYVDFPGGEAGFCRYLSTGYAAWEEGKPILEGVLPHLKNEQADNFVHGERYKRDPELVRDFINSLPIQDVAAEYVVFQPLSQMGEDETAEVVVFLADMDQFAALNFLANYARPGLDAVRLPFAAGCQASVLLPLEEAKSENPRAVAGMTDISARVHLKRQLKRDVLSFAMPWSLFKEMEANVPGSFLERPNWSQLREMAGKG
ncbi:DUF169 domain-containing protein [Desulfohalovibrio reitneri]|uniref:DUF169 domain-containing protein n=1 Tax=Desulfohalovibrio reitneri TaxID=1307759 RepID=UPI0004A76702|nr:DUF169 domain-containing protein [Desulfohalovibrio reitneri]